MKTFLITTAILVTFLGCSHNNAFDRFEMSPQRELSEENIQSSKITNNEEIRGVATAVYLNRVYPDVYKNAECFYVYLNIEDSDEEISFELNGYPSLFVEELNSTNLYTDLTQFDADWKNYYLVGFKQESSNLELRIQNDQNSSTMLRFKKSN